MEAHAIRSEKPFVAAAKQFKQMVSSLESAETRQMSHTEVEEKLFREGNALLQTLFQSHLDLRASAEVTGGVVGNDGVRRVHRRPSERGLMTRFGPVKVRRTAYGARDVSRRHPLDAELGLPSDLYSYGLRRWVAQQAAKMSFDDVESSLRSNTGGAVPKRQVEQLAVRSAQDFDGFYETRRQQAPRGDAAGEILVLTLDGKGVPMLKAHLRALTRKAGKVRKSKMKHRQSKGEKRASKRMATVAAVYTIAPFVRTAEEIMHELRPVRAAPIRRPRPQGKRVWADLEKTPEDVVREAFAEATYRDPQHDKQWVALVDGNEHQIDLVERVADEMGVEVTLVLDFIHAAEYLWKAAWVFNKEGTKASARAAEKWVQERLYKILCGKAVHVAAGIRRSATLRGLSPGQRKPADKCADYLLKYADMMRYDDYLHDGLPIATGVIEGACRYLVKDRMEITGARWTLGSAQGVLRLRALQASGDFDDYWRFHLQQEHQRNHDSRYLHGPPRLVYPPTATARRPTYLRVVK